jgi:hypothetical protein
VSLVFVMKPPAKRTIDPPGPHACATQVPPPEHAVHAAPPFPHAPLSVPGWHAPDAQHPVHDVVSHAHAPDTQCKPLAHVPCAHTPAHSSDSPHAFPAQLGMHVPVPHVFGPPPPHVPASQPPQVTI